MDGLFDHAITFKNDSIINLDYSLFNDDNVYIIEPKNWHGYKAKYLDTVINSLKLNIEMRSKDILDEQRDSIFKKLLPTYGFAQAGTNKISSLNLSYTSVNGLDKFFSRLHIRLRM